jgi:hypothetical protein
MVVNQPGGYAEMGVFSAARQWRTAIGFIPGVLAQFALPLPSHILSCPEDAPGSVEENVAMVFLPEKTGATDIATSGTAPIPDP